MTITEALAELKTIQKRIEKKQGAMGGYLARQDGIRDPLEKDGGSVLFIERERQAVTDLQTRLVKIRTTIQQVNQMTPIMVAGDTKTIAEWLTWRKEVAPNAQQFVKLIRGAVNDFRKTALQKGQGVYGPGQTPTAPTDVIVNVNEVELATLAEHLETVLGELDGQLSLKNATVMVDV